MRKKCPGVVCGSKPPMRYRLATIADAVNPAASTIKTQARDCIRPPFSGRGARRMPGFRAAICTELAHIVSFRSKVTWHRVREAGGLMVRARSEFGGLTKRRSGWFAPAVAFFVTACLSAVAFAYYFAPGPPGLGEELPEPTDATRPVALAIGATRF